MRGSTVVIQDICAQLLLSFLHTNIRGKGYSIDSYPQIMYNLFSYKIVYDALTAGMSTFVKFYSLTGINKFITFCSFI